MNRVRPPARDMMESVSGNRSNQIHMRQLLVLVILTLLLFRPAQAQETGALPLEATFTSADGALTFSYPAAWFTRAAGEVVILATAEPLLPTDAPLDFGQMRATLTARPKTRFMPDVEPGAPLESIVAALLAPRSAQGCDPASAPQPLVVNARPALRIDQTCGFYETIFLLVDLDNDLVGVVAGETPLGGRAKYAATLAAIAGTLTLRPPQINAPAQEIFMTQTFIAPDFTFTYPEGWIAREERIGGAGVVILSRTDDPFRLPPAPGQPVAIVSRGAVSAATGAPLADAPAPRPVAVLAAVIAAQGAQAAAYTAPEEFTLANRPAARAYANFTNTMETGVYARLLADGDAYGYLEAYAAPGELLAAEPIFLAALASLTDTLVPVIQTTQDELRTTLASSLPTTPPTETPIIVPTATATATPQQGNVGAQPAVPLPTVMTITPTRQADVGAVREPPTLPITPPLPEMYNGDVFTFAYPAGWTVSAAGSIVILTGDDARVVITQIDAAGMSAADALRARDLTDEAVIALTLPGGTAAAQGALSSGEMLLVVPLDDARYALLTVIGDYAALEPTILALAATLTGN